MLVLAIVALFVCYALWAIFRWRSALVFFLALLPLLPGLRPLDRLPEVSIYRLLLLPILAGFLLHAAVRRRDLSVRWVSIAMTLWVAVNVIASFTSLEVSRSLKRTLTLLEYVPLLYMVAALQTSPLLADRSRKALVAGLSVVIVYAMVEITTGSNLFYDAGLFESVLMEQDYVHLHARAGTTRIAGPMGQPINLGLYLAMVVPLAMVVIARGRRRWKWVVLSTVAVLSLWIEYRTFSRGPWVGCAAACAASLCVWSWHRRTLWGVVALSALVLVGWGLADFVPPDLKEFVGQSLGTGGVKQDPYIDGRIEIVRTATELLRERRAFGLGPGVAFHSLSDQRGGPLARYGGVSGLENQYAYVALDTGLVGLIAYLLLLSQFGLLALRGYVSAGRQAQSREQLAVLSAWVGFVVTAATVQTAGFQTMVLVSLVGYSFAVADDRLTVARRLPMSARAASKAR